MPLWGQHDIIHSDPSSTTQIYTGETPTQKKHIHESLCISSECYLHELISIKMKTCFGPLIFLLNKVLN